MSSRPFRSAAAFDAVDAADILIVPGRGGSCAQHWQSDFERRHAHARRVVQDDWDNPDLEAWAQRIAAATLESARPVLAVAHSFGCLALARAVTAYAANVEGALLVAPADPQRFSIAATVLEERLHIPALLIASDNDPWLRAAQAAELARRWGSRYLNLGLVGHINVAAGFGPWPQADDFVASVWREAQERAARADIHPFLRPPGALAGVPAGAPAGVAQHR